jgi:ParB-like chromosome segregation protein Spo0J
LNPRHRFHPLVEIFPEMEKHAFAELVADIKANGIREPVTVHKNQILDGRNRWLACEVLGIPCPQRAYEGKESDLLAFVFSKNFHRRHLDASQRAMIAAKIANMSHGGDRKSDQAAALPLVSQAEAGKRADVSERSVRDAVKVIAKAEPEVATAVGQGEGKIPVSAAAKIAAHPPEVQRQAVAAIAGGAKPAAVVRALPASAGKVGPGKEAVRTTRGDASDTPPIPRWVWGHLLEFDTTGALSHDAAEILAQMSRDERRDVARVAKLLIPWLQTMIGECRKVHKAARADKIAEGDRQQMPLPGIKREQEGNPLAPKAETADQMTTAQTRRRA